MPVTQRARWEQSLCEADTRTPGTPPRRLESRRGRIGRGPDAQSRHLGRRRLEMVNFVCDAAIAKTYHTHDDHRDYIGKGHPKFRSVFCGRPRRGGDLFCILQPLAKRGAPIVVARVNVEFLVVMAPAAFL